jgi:hypothetical protein
MDPRVDYLIRVIADQKLSIAARMMRIKNPLGVDFSGLKEL